MKVSDYIARSLAAYRVANVYELVGGMITHLIDSIHQDGRITLVSVRHEQAAAFAADATGRVTGVPGVAMATSGPGATNLLTGVGSCYFDSSPAVFITGQVNRHERKGERAIRQLGFQETDIVAMAGPITKAAVRVEHPEQVPEVLAAAFVFATAGRPGPVLVDIPMDVQGAEIDEQPPASLELSAADAEALLTGVLSAGAGDQPAGVAPAPRADVGEAARAIAAALGAAQRPLILAGAGVRSAGSSERLRRVAARAGVPVVNSLLAVDALAGADPLRAGLIGSYGNRWANMALGESDFVLVLGSRLDVRQTGADVPAFEQGRTIFHVDTDPAEINNRLTRSHGVIADVADLLAALEPELAGEFDFTAWRRRIGELRREWPDTGELPDIEGINPNALMHEISAVSAAAAGYVVDVGQHQQWAAQSLELAPHQLFLTSGGMGAMGFALPAAIGASFSVRDAPWVVIAGDGAFQLNLQELQTVVHSRLPLKLVILDNGCHGMVRQFQETYFGERYQSTMWGYSAPDFVAVASAFGIGAARVEQPAEIGEALAQLWSDPREPRLLEVKIDTLANAYPKLAFGRPITEMEPFAKPVAMEGT